MASDSRFDFEKARQRLAQLKQALESSQQSPEEAERVLRERAEAYSEAPQRSLLASEQIEILRFELAGEQYAIESRFVSEVLRSSAITDVPWTPDFLRGVLNLRGEILAVMDLAGLLCASSSISISSISASDQEQWVLVLGADMPEFGIAVEDVHEVTWVRTDAVLPPARAAQEVRREWIRGVTEDAVVILDGRAVLNDKQFHIDLAET